MTSPDPTRIAPLVRSEADGPLPEEQTVSMSPAGRPSLAIRLFGSIEVHVGGSPIPPLRTRKGEWLLALLVLRAGAEVRREWLAGLLWPEAPESRALGSLRRSLNDVRRALGEAVGRLRSPTARTLAVDLMDAEVDVLAFDAAIARGDEPALEHATTLYRGPLLRECPEAWVFEERVPREQSYLRALETLAEWALERGQPSAAEAYLRRAVAVDPLRESAQRALMQALAAAGGYAAALLSYRELRARLHRDLNAEPDPETTTLFEQIRTRARTRPFSTRVGSDTWFARDTGIGSERDRAEESSLARLAGQASGGVSLLARHNLPLSLTSFVGRETEVAELHRLL